MMLPSGSRGFTLLEILASIAILAIVLTALFQLHLQTLSMGADARFDATAPLLAQKKLAQIEAGGLQDFRSDAGGFGEDFSRYRWEASVTEIESIDFEEAALLLRKIEVRVFDDGEENSYALRTYRYLK